MFCNALKFCLFFLIYLVSVAIGEDITLRCDEAERYSKYNGSGSELFCTVSNFYVSHSQVVKIQKYPDANTTKFMKFYDSRLLYVPFKLFDIFISLKTLDVSHTEILEIPRNTFGAANFLTYLNMSNNNITQITTSVFMGAGNLMRLDLSYNKITEINENAFRGLMSLNKLILTGNQLKQIAKDIFSENMYIESVDMDHNLIEYIEPEVFNRLRRIRNVNLSNNRMHLIHPGTFEAAYGVETLLLSYNYLNEFYLDKKSIASTLVLDSNNLTSITINATKYVRADHNKIRELHMVNGDFLDSLQLVGNNLSNISNITSLSGLSHLDLSYNPIKQLNITTFDNLRRLRSLYLRFTGISSLSFGMFSKQLNLESLDLSFNNLNELNLDIFVPYLSNLKHFYIDGNNLTELQGKHTFALAFPNLVKLGLSRNRFNCSYLHTLLTPPFLQPTVTLGIERDDSDVETSHIRDVSCISEVKQNLQSTQQELNTIKEMQSTMQQSMEMLRLHERRLEVYLNLLRIALLLMACLVVGFVGLKMWKTKRTQYFARRGGSISFHSDATIHTNIEQT